MARFMVERMFPGGLDMPVSDAGVAEVLGVVDGEEDEVGVTWIHSFVSNDRTKTFWSLTDRTRSASAEADATGSRSTRSPG